MNTLYDSILLIASYDAFPSTAQCRGRARVAHEDLISIFTKVLQTGMQWRAIDGMDFRTAHRHFIRWCRAGVFQTAYKRVRRLLHRSTRNTGRDYVAIDSTYVKNVYGTDVVGRNPTDRGRLATKVVAAVDGTGLPIKIAFCDANESDHSALNKLLPLGARWKRKRVYADKGFDSRAARVRLKREGLLPRISRRGQNVSVWEERRRRVVEHFFSWLDKSRRLIVRYDTTIAAYRGWTWLACCRIGARRIQV